MAVPANATTDQSLAAGTRPAVSAARGLVNYESEENQMSLPMLTYVVVNDQDQYVSQEHPTMQEAINDAQARGNCAVVELQYEMVDSDLAWTPDGADSWPPVGAKFQIVAFKGQYLYNCPTDLCTQLFRGAELEPGSTFMCPQCGGLLRVPKDFMPKTSAATS